MSWKKLKKIFYVIVEKEKANKTYSQEWRDFTNLALVVEKNPPTAVERAPRQGKGSTRMG